MDLEAIALKLEPGCIYALEYDDPLSLEAADRIAKQCEQLYKKMGIRFVILPERMRLVRDDAA